MSGPQVTDAQKAPRRPVSWAALICGLFALHFAMGALNGKHPSDLTWIAQPMAQAVVVTALVLALVVPGLAFIWVFFRRLNMVTRRPAGRAIAVYLGLGVVAASGSIMGGALTGDPSFATLLDFALVFPISVLFAALSFFVIVRLFFSSAAGDARAQDVLPGDENAKAGG